MDFGETGSDRLRWFCIVPRGLLSFFSDCLDDLSLNECLLVVLADVLGSTGTALWVGRQSGSACRGGRMGTGCSTTVNISGPDKSEASSAVIGTEVESDSDTTVP